MKSVERTFSTFDEGGKGFLTKHELKCAVLYLHGSVPPALSLREVAAECGGKVELQRFREVAGRLPSHSEAEKTAEVFKAMDTNNRGFVTRPDFEEVCERYAKFLSPAVRRDLFAELDSNTDGRVTLRDLSRCLSYSL